MVVFHLIEIALEQIVSKNNAMLKILKKDEQGAVNTKHKEIGIFSSLDKAEKAMMQTVEENKDMPFVNLGFFIAEREVDDPHFNEQWDSLGSFVSLRSYLADGTVNCISRMDTSCKKKFRGREDKICLKTGDLAWWYCGSKIKPVLIGELPLSASEWKKRIKGFGDFTDDSYTVFTVFAGHEHPFAPNIFPYTGKISKILLKKLETERDWYYDGNI